MRDRALKSVLVGNSCLPSYGSPVPVVDSSYVYSSHCHYRNEMKHSGRAARELQASNPQEELRLALFKFASVPWVEVSESDRILLAELRRCAIAPRHLRDGKITQEARDAKNARFDLGEVRRAHGYFREALLRGDAAPPGLRKRSRSYNVEGPKAPKGADLSGSTFGCLVVQAHVRTTFRGWKVWRCSCVCGVVCEASTGSLRSGKKQSCGCKQYSTGKGVYNFTGYEELTGSKWYSIKSGALARGLSFEITKEEVWGILISQKRLCKVSGIPISFKAGTASVDRINNAEGYSLSNIQLVHKDVNLMRNKFSVDRYVEVCKAVALHNASPT